MNSLEQLQTQLESEQALLDQRAAWNPALSGEIDIRIDRQGNWFHEGTEIHRQGLVKLFAGILRREQDGQYYLVTPVEKWRIQVEDLPFLVVALEQLKGESGFPELVMETNQGDRVLVDIKHPIVCETDNAQATPRPRLELELGLCARINRPTYYQLVELALQQPDSQQDGQLWLGAGDQRFSLGSLEAD